MCQLFGNVRQIFEMSGRIFKAPDTLSGRLKSLIPPLIHTYPIGTGVEHSIYITVKSRIHILPKQRSNRVNTPCYTLEDHQLTGLVFVSVYHTYMSAPKLSMSDVCVCLLRREGNILHLHPLAAKVMLMTFLKVYSHFCAYRYQPLHS